MGDEFNVKKFGAIVAFPFSKANLTTGEADTDLTAGQGTLHVMAKGGSVVALGIQSNAAITAGTITAKAHSSSTEFADTGAPAPVASSDNQGSFATVRPGAVTFDAGDSLGVSVTTTTTLDATDTLDVDAVLYVQLDPQ